MSAALNPLVEKVRAAHPGAYDDLDDATLTKRVLAKYPQYSDLAAPAMKPFQLDMQEHNVLDDPNTVGKPSKGIAPAGKLSGLPFVNPHEPSYREATGDIALAGAPLAALGTPAAVAKGVAGSAIGAPVARKAAELLGAGPTLKDFAETGGGVVGGMASQFELPQGSAIGAKAKAVGTLAAKDAASHIPIAGRLVRRPSLGDYWEAAWTKVPEPAPTPSPSAPAPKEFSLSPEPTPTAPSKAATSKVLDSQLRDAVGAPPSPRPGIAMKEQFNPAAQPKPRTVQEGHTAVNSSAVDSFKYDSQAKELHVATPDGTTYVYGDADPTAAQTLGDAPSKGKAWKTIRDNHPLVAKIVDGKRIAVKPSGPRTFGPDGEIDSSDDLVNALKKSLAHAQR